MARLPRVAVTDVPHHVTQRGNARQTIFATDSDRLTFLDLLRQYSQLYDLSLLGYCLMSNHIHLVAVPHAPHALSQCLQHAHGRYAAYWNARQASSGHVWQGRFYSCPLDEPHLWTALRYVELNPVRAGLSISANQWQWSSAAAHSGLAIPDPILDIHRWRQSWDATSWLRFLGTAESDAELRALRHSTYTGRPLGDADFLSALESTTSRHLAPKKGGRPRKYTYDNRQLRFESAA